MPRLSRAALVLSTAIIPGIAAAQEPVVLDAITLYASDAYVTGQTEVSEEDLKAAQNGGLADLFRSEPGVLVDGGIAMTERVYVNGIDQEQMAVTIDGAMQNNRMWHHTATNLIDPGLLKTARVDAGVAPADAGPDALGGSIEYETVSALDLLQDGKNFGGKLTTGYESNGETATGALTLYGRQGPVDGLLYVKRATGHDYEGGDGGTVEYTGADLNSYMVKLGAGANGWRFEYGGIRVKDTSLRPFRPNVVDYVGRDSAPRYFDMTQNTHTLKIRRTEATSDQFNPELLVSSSKHELTATDLPRADGRTPNRAAGEGESFSAVLQNHFRIGQTEISAGVDVHNRTSSLDDYYINRADEAVNTSFREDSHNTGVFVQARGSVGQFDYSSGLRYDWNRFYGTDAREIRSDGASGNANLTWHATDSLSFDAGYSSVFGGIPLNQGYVLYQDGAYENLRSARSQNAILGATWEQGGTSIGGELFRTKIGNARSDGNLKEIRSEGWRVSLGHRWDGGGATLRYSDIDVEVDGKAPTSNDIRGFGTVPGRTLALTANHEVSRGLTVGGVIEHAFAEPYQGVDPSGEARRNYDAYTVVNIYGEYTPARYENLTIRAEVNNLFDEDYADRASYGGDFEFVESQKEPGRSIAVTANFTF